jgi:hypothetical protein
MTSTCAACQRTIIGPSLKKGFHFAVFRSIEAAGRDWDAAAPAANFFLQRPFLAVLEANPPKGMRFSYLIYYKNNDPVGVALCQIQHFNAGETLQQNTTKEREPCFFNSLGKWFKRWVAAKASADLLVCGNLLLSGEYGYYFNKEAVREEDVPVLLENGWQEVIQLMERDGLKVPVILLKDLAEQHRNLGREFAQDGFIEFEIQPIMRMALPFTDFDAYLSAMSTKYRTRAKRAFKKAKDIDKREFGYLDIQRERAQIHQLYLSIANNAGFNMVDLNPQYLPALKKELGERFRMFAYYLEGRLIAFYTILQNGSEIEAHFLGFDRQMNHDKQLYLNILYDIVRYAIDSGAHSINFARTALEIKSSVGAEPEVFYCYLRHRNPLTNRFTSRMMDYLKPVEVWQQRHPFKTGMEHEGEE